MSFVLFVCACERVFVFVCVCNTVNRLSFRSSYVVVNSYVYVIILTFVERVYYKFILKIIGFNAQTINSVFAIKIKAKYHP